MKDAKSREMSTTTTSYETAPLTYTGESKKPKKPHGLATATELTGQSETAGAKTGGRSGTESPKITRAAPDKSPAPSASGSSFADATAKLAEPSQKGRPEEDAQNAEGSSTAQAAEQPVMKKEVVQEVDTSKPPAGTREDVKPGDATQGPHQPPAVAVATGTADTAAPPEKKVSDDSKVEQKEDAKDEHKDGDKAEGKEKAEHKEPAVTSLDPSGATDKEKNAKESPGKSDPAKPERSSTLCRPLFPALLVVFAVSLSLAAVILGLVEHLRNRDRPVIKGHFGSVRGQRLVFADQGRDWTVHAFLGIPFAQFPGGPVRFKPPLPLDMPLGDQRSGKTLESVQKRPPCPQQDFYLGLESVSTSNASEDCLHLNIWAPPWKCDPEQQEPGDCEQRTVLFFLYGAAFQNGGNSLELYDGRYLSALGDLVVVVPNYRVGALGFLSGPSSRVLPGNAGLHDQQLALSWTLANINIFGGNASRIVLAGHDAGAASLGYHLFRGDAALWTRNVARYIFQSGGPYHRYEDDGLEGGRRLALSIECTADLATEAALLCLQKADVAAVARSPLAPKFMPVFNQPPFSRIKPHGEKQEAKTGPQGKRFLLGRVQSEGAYPWFLEQLRSGQGDPHRLASRLLGPGMLKTWETATGITLLPSSGEVVYQQAVSDVLQACPMSELAEQLYAWQNTVYVYVLGYRPKYSSWRNQTEAVHFEDIHLVFGMPLRPEVPSSDLDKRWARTMIHVWATFARTGKAPTVLDSKWPPYDSNWPSFMKLGPEGASYEVDDKRARCDFLRHSGTSH